MKFMLFSWCCVLVIFFSFSRKGRCYSENLSDLDNSNEDIWNFEETSSDHWAQQALQALCDQYDFVTKNGKVSCDDITLSAKFLSQDDSFQEHDIVKRQANADELEGSGEPDDTEIISSSPTIKQTEKTDLVTNELEKLKEISASTLKTVDNTTEYNLLNQTLIQYTNIQKENATDGLEVQENLPENIKFIGFSNHTEKVPFSPTTKKNELETNQPEKPKEISAGTLKTVDNEYIKFSNKTLIQETNIQKENVTDGLETQENLLEQKLTASEKPKIEQTSSTVQISESLRNSTATVKSTEKTSQQEIVTQKQEPKSVVSTDENVKEKETNVYESGKENENTTQKKSKDSKTKEKETIDEQQDANTEILLKHPVAAVAVKGFKGAEISEGEKILHNMEVSAESNLAESTKDVTKASKDTTILIVLFAVVVVVGGAAFTYNKVKQRRNKRLADSNVNGKTDVEQGTELKPLMKNDDQKLVNNDVIKSEEGNSKS